MIIPTTKADRRQRAQARPLQGAVFLMLWIAPTSSHQYAGSATTCPCPQRLSHHTL